MIPDIDEWTLRENIRMSKVPERKVYSYYMAKISRLAMGQFKYTSKDVNDLFLIEKYLWLDGRVMIWYSDILGWVITRCMETGYNINGLAIKWKPILEHTNVDTVIPTPEMGLDDKCVVIYDLPSRMCTSSYCTIWVEELADINETIKSQIFLQKTPMIAICDNPKDKNLLKKAIVDIANNVKVLFVGKDFRADVKSFNMETPFNISDLQAHLKTKESEMLEFLGIDSQSSFQKKERLITSEQDSNGQILTYLLNDRFESRANALETLKEKGCTITIEKILLDDPNTEKDEKEDTDNAITDDTDIPSDTE